MNLAVALDYDSTIIKQFGGLVCHHKHYFVDLDFEKI